MNPPSKGAFRTVGHVVWFGARAAEGVLGSFLLPQSAAEHSDSTLLCLRPSAKATPDRI